MPEDPKHSFYVEELEIVTRRLYDGIIEGCEKVILPALQKLDELLVDIDLRPIYTTHVEKTLMILHKISCILKHEFEAFSIKDENGEFVQSLSSETLSLFFEEIRHENIHAREKDGIRYECTYHLESLFAHLVMAMIITIATCIHDASIQDAIVIGFIALVHDIGKLTTQRLIGGKSNFTVFTGHAAAGGLILSRILKNFTRFFNSDEIDQIVRSVTVHMCGYHCTKHGTLHPEKMCYLSYENPRVKQILGSLRVGDGMGKYSENSATNNQNVMGTQQDFVQAMAYEIPHSKKFSGVVFSVTGQSGSGKSTLAERISNILTKLGFQSKVLSRDMCTMFLMAQITGSPIEFGDVPSGKEYRDLYDNYRSKEHGKAVNDLFLQKLTEYLHQGFIVILDTQATMFANRYNPHILERLQRKDLFIITVICSRDVDCPLTQADADRRGLTLDEQLKLFGTTSTLHPFPQTINLDTVESRMEKDPDQSPLYKSNIVITTSWHTGELASFHETIRRWVYFALVPESVPMSGDIVSGSVPMSGGIVPESDANADSNESCIEWLQRLFDESGRNIDVFKDKLLSYNITLDKRCNSGVLDFYRVTYIDGRCILYDLFIPRHVIFAHNLETHEFLLIRYIMPRGPEGLTRNNIENGVISNESMSRDKIDHLPTNLQSVLKAFMQPERHPGKKIDISFKVDGSIICIQFILDKFIRSAYTEIMVKAGGIHSTLVEKCKDLQYLIVISTSGTHLISKMLGYFVTSFSEAVLGTQVDASMSPEEVFKSDYFIDGLLEKCDSLFREILPSLKDTNSSITVTFEGVVSNRTTAWGEHHTELAINYPNSMFKLHSWAFISLGAKKYKYLPHTKAQFKQSTFQEPLYWGNTSICDASQMISCLNDVAKGQFTIEEFFCMYPPTNSNTDRSFDLEGFVCYIPIVENGTSRIIYIKLKTTVYYWTHKLKDRNIENIASLPESTHAVFPIARVIFTIKNGLPKTLVEIALRLKGSFTDYMLNGMPGINFGAAKAISKMESLEKQIRSVVSNLYSAGQLKIFVSIYGTIFSIDGLFPIDYLEETHEKFDSRISQFNSLLLLILCPWKDESTLCTDLGEMCDNFGKTKRLQDISSEKSRQKKLQDISKQFESLITYMLSKCK